MPCTKRSQLTEKPAHAPREQPLTQCNWRKPTHSHRAAKEREQTKDWEAAEFTKAKKVTPILIFASMGFSRQEHQSGLPFPSPGDLPNPGIELAAPAAPVLQAESLALSHQGRSKLRPSSHIHQNKLQARTKETCQETGFVLF